MINQFFSDSEVAIILGKPLASIDDELMALFNNTPVASQVVEPSGISSSVLPTISQDSLLDELEVAANSYLELPMAGIEQLLSINIDTELFELLVYQLAENAKPGWSFISFEGQLSYGNQPAADELGLIFDTETLVKHGNYPIIATIVSHKGFYIWLADSWDGVTQYQPEYVDLGSDRRLIVCHNLAFDYCLIKQRFELTNSVYGLCTMAMAKALYSVDRKHSYLLNTTGRLADAVQSVACKMSLVSVYEFLTKTKLPENSKEIRNAFVDANELTDLLPIKLELFKYALKDTILTLEVFQRLYSSFISWHKSPIVLQGLIQSANSLTPIIPNYTEWLTNNAKLTENTLCNLFQVVFPVADKLHTEWLDGYLNPDDYEFNLAKLDWRLSKPAGWRKRSLPDGYPKIAKWYASFLTGQFSWSGNELAYLLQLKWRGQPLQQAYREGWYVKDRFTGLVEKVPHPKHGLDKNLGTVTSGSCISYVEQDLITSSVLSQEELLKLYKLLDSMSIWEGYSARMIEAKTVASW